MTRIFSCLLYFLFLISPYITIGQVREVAITSRENNFRFSASDTTLQLPFWEDFFGQSGEPSSTHWEDSSHVTVNSYYAYRAPSMGVATFDGLKSNGDAYNTDPESSEKTDRLESNFIDLSGFSATDNIYISFYYQFGGYGEKPDIDDGDKLVLEFKNSAGDWVTAHTIEPDENVDPMEFYQIILPIEEADLFHSEFQFAFQSYGNQSGAYDIWNIDYIYVNSGRNANDLFYPDGTIVSGITNIFGGYTSIPRMHFNKEEDLIQPTFTITTLKNEFHIYKHSVFLEVKTLEGDFTRNYNLIKDGSSVIGLESEYVTPRIPGLVTATYNGINGDSTTVVLQGIADEDLPVADTSIYQLDYTVALRTFDNTVQGDYTPNYAPIDFRTNDTLRATFYLADYYAYDDGTAESAVSLLVPGNTFAYKFALQNVDSAYIHGIDINTVVSGESALGKAVDLHIYKAKNGVPAEEIFVHAITLQGDNSTSTFERYEFINPILVRDTFFIGMTSRSSGRIPIGLDKNNNSSSKVFELVQGSWLPINDRFNGAIMMRPVVGPEPEGYITDVDDVRNEKIVLFPNPSSNGSFTITGNIQQVNIFDVTGRQALFTLSSDDDRSEISIKERGIYIVKAVINNKYYIFKAIYK